MSWKLQKNKYIVFWMEKKLNMLAYEWNPQIHKWFLESQGNKVLESIRENQ